MGFAAIGLSEFVPISLFGLGTSLTLLVALVSDLLLLPSMLVVCGIADVEFDRADRFASVKNAYALERLVTVDHNYQ